MWMARVQTTTYAPSVIPAQAEISQWLHAVSATDPRLLPRG
ncbi:hypothetical protein [Brenneria sp. g21c3]